MSPGDAHGILECIGKMSGTIHHLQKVKETEEEKKESITVEETLQAAGRLFHVFWRSCPNWGGSHFHT